MLQVVNKIVERGKVIGYTLMEDDTGMYKDCTSKSVINALMCGVYIKGLSERYFGSKSKDNKNITLVGKTTSQDGKIVGVLCDTITGDICSIGLGDIKGLLQSGMKIRGVSLKGKTPTNNVNSANSANSSVGTTHGVVTAAKTKEPFSLSRNAQNFMNWKKRSDALDYQGEFKFELLKSGDIRCRYIGDGTKPVILPREFYVTDMYNMFNGCEAESLDLSRLDTSKVTNMKHMFHGCKATSLDLRNLDTSNVTNMSWMFCECSATSIDLSNLDTGKVTNMCNMFADCEARTLDLSNFDTSNVTNMGSMFQLCHATYINLSNFNTSNVKDMSWMFDVCKARTLDLRHFDISNVTDMDGIFSDYEATVIVSEKQIEIIKLLKEYCCKYEIA